MKKMETLKDKEKDYGHSGIEIKGFDSFDVKEAVDKYYNWLNNNVEYSERDRLFNKFKEIFGDFLEEQLENEI